VVNVVSLLLFSLEKLRIFKNGAPCLGLGCVQKRVECKWESEIYYFLPLARPKWATSSRCPWLIDIDQDLIAVTISEQLLLTDSEQRNNIPRPSHCDGSVSSPVQGESSFAQEQRAWRECTPRYVVHL